MKPITRKIITIGIFWWYYPMMLIIGTFMEWIENDKSVLESAKDAYRIIFDK